VLSCRACFGAGVRLFKLRVMLSDILALYFKIMPIRHILKIFQKANVPQHCLSVRRDKLQGTGKTIARISILTSLILNLNRRNVTTNVRDLIQYSISTSIHIAPIISTPNPLPNFITTKYPPKSKRLTNHPPSTPQPKSATQSLMCSEPRSSTKRFERSCIGSRKYTPDRLATFTIPRASTLRAT
jgi:hypothetical protein